MSTLAHRENCYHAVCILPSTPNVVDQFSANPMTLFAICAISLNNNKSIDIVPGLGSFTSASHAVTRYNIFILHIK
jgi:hypothetical protein